MRYLPTVFILLLVAGCQAIPPAERLDSPRFVVPEGSVLELRAPLDIPGNEVSVFVQEGRVMRFPAVDQYYPYCKFELWTMAQVPRTVEPDRFAVRKVSRDWHYVGRRFPLRVAGIAIDGDSDAGGPLFQVSSTMLYLRSERQPDVYRLTCERWDDVTEGRHLTIRQIRGALGDLFSLELPPELEVQ